MFSTLFIGLTLLINDFPSVASQIEDQVDRAAIDYDFDSFFENYCLKDPGKKFEKKFRDYTIRISNSQSTSCGTFQIEKGERIVYEGNTDSHDAYIQFYLIFRKEKQSRKQNFMLSLTGSGQTQIAVYASVGGAHGGGSLLIFDLSDQFRKLDPIDGGEFGPPYLIDLDKDGIPEVVVIDDIFAYTFGCFGCSPQGTVVLKYTNGKYVASRKLMYRSAPTKSSIGKWKKDWEKEFRETENLANNFPPPDFLQALTDLVYTGHADQALNFINQIWPRDVSRKGEFIKKYRDQLSGSQYAAKLAKELR